MPILVQMTLDFDFSLVRMGLTLGTFPDAFLLSLGVERFQLFCCFNGPHVAMATKLAKIPHLP